MRIRIWSKIGVRNVTIISYNVRGLGGVTKKNEVQILIQVYKPIKG